MAEASASSLAARLARLEDEAAIRAALALYGRAIDRNDATLLAELFHADAQVDYGPDVHVGNALTFVPAVLASQGAMVRTQHMAGQSVIQLEGDQARVESYGQATHIISRGDDYVEFTSGSRYLDIFERRDGHWRIARRQVVVDWLRELVADDSLFHRLRGPARGARGDADASANLFT